MAFWETMTIAEMNVLLEKRNEPVIKAGWDELIEATKSGQKNKNDAVWHDGPLVPAIYFFSCVAGNAACNGECITSQDLLNISRKCLPEFWTTGNAKQLGFFLDLYGNDSDNMVPHCPVGTKLGAMMDAVKRFNKETWNYGYGGQWRIPDEGWDNLRGVLDGWSDTCQKMWLTAQAPEPPQTAPEELTHQAPIEGCEEQKAKNPTFAALYDLVDNGVKQIILNGAPGTGKTYTAGLLAQYMGNVLPEYEQKVPPYPLVQFHPSYDYTDFVEGLRPVRVEGEKNPAFVKLDGSFKAFCRQVAETNRADLSKVFGELMFCLEADKRGKSVQTQYRNLPAYACGDKAGTFSPLENDVFAEGFFIPENVVIIGTMNDIDRSVESMDFALRRRFEFLEVKVDQSLLENAFKGGKFGRMLQNNAKQAAQLVMQLNGVIGGEEGRKFGLTRQYYISQGQLANLPDLSRYGKYSGTLDGLMQYVWDYRVKSLLREYLRGEDEDEVNRFLTMCAAALGIKADREPGTAPTEPAHE